MTGQQIFEGALALLMVPERDSADYRNVAVTVINTVTAECFDVNNSVREARCLEPRKEPVFISSLSEEVSAQHYLVYKAFLYGVASKLVGDEDLQRAVYFHNLYVEGLADCTKAVARGVIDVYKGGGL